MHLNWEEIIKQITLKVVYSYTDDKALKSFIFIVYIWEKKICVIQIIADLLLYSHIWIKMCWLFDISYLHLLIAWYISDPASPCITWLCSFSKKKKKNLYADFNCFLNQKISQIWRKKHTWYNDVIHHDIYWPHPLCRTGSKGAPFSTMDFVCSQRLVDTSMYTQHTCLRYLVFDHAAIWDCWICIPCLGLFRHVPQAVEHHHYQRLFEYKIHGSTNIDSRVTSTLTTSKLKRAEIVIDIVHRYASVSHAVQMT